MWETRRVSYKKQELLPHRAHLDFVLVVSVLVIVFVFYVVFCLSSSCILCAQCSEFLDCPFLITPSVFSDVDIIVPVNHIRLLFTSLSLALIWQLFYLFCSSIVVNTVIVTAETLSRNDRGRFGALKSDSTHHCFRNACTKSGSLRFSQFTCCWLILSVYILMSFDFPFVRLFGVR